MISVQRNHQIQLVKSHISKYLELIKIFILQEERRIIACSLIYLYSIGFYLQEKIKIKCIMYIRSATYLNANNNKKKTSVLYVHMCV